MIHTTFSSDYDYRDQNPIQPLILTQNCSKTFHVQPKVTFLAKNYPFASNHTWGSKFLSRTILGNEEFFLNLAVLFFGGH